MERQKIYVWNPRTWYQWLLGGLLFVVPTLAIIWFAMFLVWAG